MYIVFFELLYKTVDIYLCKLCQFVYWELFHLIPMSFSHVPCFVVVVAAQDASGLSCIYAVLAIESVISQARPNSNPYLSLGCNTQAEWMHRLRMVPGELVLFCSWLYFSGSYTGKQGLFLGSFPDLPSLLLCSTVASRVRWVRREVAPFPAGRSVLPNKGNTPWRMTTRALSYRGLTHLLSYFSVVSCSNDFVTPK